MGRIDLPDKPSENRTVTESYLAELYDKIAQLKQERDELRAQLELRAA